MRVPQTAVTGRSKRGRHSQLTISFLLTAALASPALAAARSASPGRSAAAGEARAPSGLRTSSPADSRAAQDLAVERLLARLGLEDPTTLEPLLLGGIDDPELDPKERSTLLTQAIERQTRAYLSDPQLAAQLRGALEAPEFNRSAVRFQSAASLLFGSGRTDILTAYLPIEVGGFPPRIRRPLQTPAQKIAKGVAKMGLSAAVAYLAPPVAVPPGYRFLPIGERIAAIAGNGWVLPTPERVELLVDDPADPASCSGTVDLETNSGGQITDFGDFLERQLAWGDPFGSYPGPTDGILELLPEIALVTAPLLDLSELEDLVDIGTTELPSLPSSITNFFDGLISSSLDIEDSFYSSFEGWSLDPGAITCADGACTAPDGPSTAAFRGLVSNLPGILGYTFVYQQGVFVQEVFQPTFPGVAEPLTVYLEALEPGGARTNLPPTGFDGAPLPSRGTLFDASWIGIADNCDPSPLLQFELPNFLELGIHQLPIRGTDRSGNVTDGFVTVVVQDSLPPNLLPPEDVGVEVPEGTSTIAFTAAGVGCVEWLCGGDPPTFQIFPPISFDFASLEPTIECLLTNSAHPAPGASCATANLQVGELNLVDWKLSDPSGNQSFVTQSVWVREAGTNQQPSAQSASFTISSGVPTELPLVATDADFDPLAFEIADLPDHGDLDVDLEAVYQTRFSQSGAIRRASGFLRLDGLDGNPSQELIVADGPSARLFIFDNDGAPRRLIDMVDLGEIQPDAIQYQDQPRVLTGTSRNEVLDNNDLYLLDATQNGPGDPSFQTLWRWDTGSGPRRLADLAGLLDGKSPREFNVTAYDNGGQEQSVDFTIYATADPEVLGNPPAPNPANISRAFRSSSSDFGSTWTVVPLGAAVATSATSAVTDGDGRAFTAFWHPGESPVGSVDGTYDLTPHLSDPDGPDNPALPTLQQPTSIGCLDTSTCTHGDLLVLDAQENKIEAFDFQGNSLVRRQNSNYPLRLTEFLGIDAIEEVGAAGGGSAQFLVLDESGIYRFDLAGRLSALVSQQTSGSQGDSVQWIDLAYLPSGEVFTLTQGSPSSGSGSSAPTIARFSSIADGVDESSQGGGQALLGSTSGGDTGWALDVNATYALAVTSEGLYRCSAASLASSCTLIISGSATEGRFRDIVLRDGTNEFYATDVVDQRVERYDTNGNFLGAIGGGMADPFDFFLDGASLDDLRSVQGGKLAYDAVQDRLYVADFPPETTRGLPTRLPRVKIYSGDGLLLETVEPEIDQANFLSWLDPGDFGSVSAIAVGPDRVYIAEAAPLQRLHVYDANVSAPVTCSDPEATCASVTYTSDAGFTGSDAFSYQASDAFGGTSSAAALSLTVVDDTLAPSITCPADLSIEARSNGGLELTDPLSQERSPELRTFFTPEISDNVDLPLPQVARDTGSSYGLGATLVTFTATDGVGQTASCSATLTVVDTTPPRFDRAELGSTTGLEASGATIAPVEAEATGPTTAFEPPAPPVFDVAGVVQLTHDGPMSYPVGETLILWTATDQGGNQAQASQIVRIVDTTKPTFETALPPNDVYLQTIANGHSNAIFYDVQTASDAVGVVDIDCAPAIGTQLSYGTHTVVCLAQDAAGNVATRTFSVDLDDDDDDSDGIGNTVDPPDRQGDPIASDASLGGQTDLRLLSTGDHILQVTDAPEPAEGLSAVILGSPGTDPAMVSACSGQLAGTLDFSVVETAPGVFEQVNDWLVLTCGGNLVAARSEYGTSETQVSLPAGDPLHAIVETAEAYALSGWTMYVPAVSYGPVEITWAGTTRSVAAGTSLDLRTLLELDTSADVAIPSAIVEPGANFQIDVLLSNASGRDALDAQVTIGLPSGVEAIATSGCLEDPIGSPVCSVGTLPAGAQVTLQLTGTVSQGAAAQLPFAFELSGPWTELDPADQIAEFVLATEGNAPTVTGFSAGQVPIDSCSTLLATPPSLAVDFSEALQVGTAMGIDGPALGLDDPAAYRLLAPGLDQSFQTLDCSSVLGDDQLLPLVSAFPGALNDSVELLPAEPLPDGLIGLLVCGEAGLVDLAGNRLDGDGNGTGGDDTGILFRSDPGNLVDNGHFDCDLRSFAAGSGSAWDSEDHRFSTDSGSGIALVPDDPQSALTQCLVPTTAAATFYASAALQAAGGVQDAEIAVRCGWSDLGCTTAPASVGEVTLSAALGPWQSAQATGELPSGPVEQALQCSWNLLGEAGQTVRLDALVVRLDIVFRDGFEKGLSSWSGAMP